MIRVLVTMLLVCFAFSVYAQPPLSKRDKKKLAEWEKELEAEKNYNETIQKAEAAFEADRYIDARMLYNKAIEYNEEKRAWLTAKVNDLDILLARNIARQVDTIKGLKARGVERIQMDKQSDGTIIVREMTMELTPLSKGEEEKPADVAPVKVEPEPAEVTKVEKPTAPVKEEANPPQEKASAEATPKPDPFEDFARGMTEDKFTFPDHEVTRIVVKDGIDTMVYKMVKHRWGGEFYFKDDISISKRIWVEQVEQYRSQFGSKPNE